MTLDDIAQRVQQIIDDPTREADENDPRILQALQDRRDAAQTAQPEAEGETRRLTEELLDIRRTADREQRQKGSQRNRERHLQRGNDRQQAGSI